MAKYTSFTLVAVGLFTSCLFAACASAESLDFGVGGAGGGVGGNGPNGTGGSPPIEDGGTPSSSSSSTSSSGSGPVCAPSCSADFDCQSTCPAVQSGSNCCDKATSMCYVSAASLCPAPPPDGGMPPMY